MKALSSAMLWFALAAPLVVVVATTQTLTPYRAQRFGQLVALVTAGAWLGVTLGGNVQSGPFAAHGPAGPVGVATGLVIARMDVPLTRRAIAANHGAFGAMLLAIVWAYGSGSVSGSRWGLAAAGVLLFTGKLGSSKVFDSGFVLGLIGVIVVVASGVWEFESATASSCAVVIGAFAVLVASTKSTSGADLAAVSLILPATLSFAIVRLASLADVGAGTGLAITAAVSGTAVAWSSAVIDEMNESAKIARTLGLWALSFALAGDMTTALMLGAPATLLVIVSTPVTWASCLPALLVAATRLTSGVVLGDGVSRLVVGVLLGLSVAGSMSGSIARSSAKGEGLWASWIGSILGAWLLVAPETWGWMYKGAPIQPVVSPLDSWAYGSGIAVAVAVVIAAFAFVMGWNSPARHWDSVAAALSPDKDATTPESDPLQ